MHLLYALEPTLRQVDLSQEKHAGGECQWEASTPTNSARAHSQGPAFSCSSASPSGALHSSGHAFYHDERLVSVLFCVLKFFVSEATERIPFVRRVDAYIGDPEDGHGKPWQAARYGTGSVFLE